jgi:hypothetical protein
MRNLFTTVVACLFVTTTGAQTEPVLPAGAEALEAKLMTRVGPQTRGWIKQEAARQHVAGMASEVTATNAITTNRSFRGLPDSDINAIAFLVMMEAAKSARDDLKAIMANVKNINEAKASLQQNAQPAKRTTEDENASRAKAASASRQIANANRATVGPEPMPKAQFAKQLQSARSNLDSLGEMGEMESLRLQSSMDKLSKVNSTISNLMKKLSDTAQSITQNLK